MRDGGWSKSRLVVFSSLLSLALTSVAMALLGDVDNDGDVDGADAQRVLESVIGVTTLTAPEAAAADVDCNNRVDVADAQLIQQLAAGQITEFPPCLPRSSGPIALTRKGDVLGVVNPDSDTVTFLETIGDTVLLEVAVGREPTGIDFSRDGLRAYVTVAREAKVAILDTTSLSVVGEIAVGVEPVAIVVNHQGDRAFVSNMSSGTVSVIDLDTESVIGTAVVGGQPQGLAVDATSSKVYVTQLRTAELSLVDTSTLVRTGITLSETPFDELNILQPAGIPNRVKGLAIHPTLDQAWVPHILSNSGNFVEALFNTSIFPAVSVVDTSSDTELGANRMTLFSGVTTVISSPEAVSFSPDGTKAYVVSASSDDLTVFNVSTRQEIALVRDVGDNPRGIAVMPDGTKGYLFNRLTPQVSVVDLTNDQLTGLVPVSTDPLPANLSNGRRLFFSSAPPEVAQDRFFSCEACHFDGREDGQTWFFTNGPRQTLSMDANSTDRTGLLHHNGDRGTVQDFDTTFTRLQNGTGLTPDQLNDLADWVTTSIRALDNPFLNADGSRTGAARAGRRVFEQAQCRSCHSGLFLTDATGNDDPANPLLHDVGIFAVGTGSQDVNDKTRDQDGVAGGTVRPAGSFESTFLIGAWATAPYLHDGRSETLLDVVTTDNPGDVHGATSSLTPAERDQLVAYLEQLSIVTARVAITFPVDDSKLVDLAKVSGKVLDDVQSVEVTIGNSSPIAATVLDGAFEALVPGGLLATLGLADGSKFDITAVATTFDGNFGRDDIEVQLNLAGNEDAATSTVEASPALILADGVSTSLITVTPGETSGQRVGTGLGLEIQATSGTVGPVTDLGNGVYEARLTSDVVAGASAVTANVLGGATFVDTAVVAFAAGDVDADLTTIASVPSAVEANGFATTTVTVTPRDAFGNNLGTGQVVGVSVDNGTIAPAVDQGNGTYTATYTADTTPGVALVTATVNATPLSGSATVLLNADVTPPSDADLSRITFTVPAVGDPQVTGGLSSVEPFATVHVENTTTTTTTNPGATSAGEFMTALAIASNETVCFQVEDLAGNLSAVVCKVPFEVRSVRGVYRTAQAGGGFTPVAGALVQLSDTDLSVAASPGFSPLFGFTDLTAADGSFEVLATGLSPDPGDLSVVTGPDVNMDSFVDSITSWALVNDYIRNVNLDEVSQAQVFVIGNCNVLGCAVAPANCHLNVTRDERKAIEQTLRDATTELDFTQPPNPTQLIVNDVFFDVDGPKDALDTIAFGTFCNAIESAGEGETPRIVEGRVTVPSSSGDVALVGVTVQLASWAIPSQQLTTLGPLATTDANGDYALSLPAFVEFGGDLVVIVIGDLTYNGAGNPGVFNGGVAAASIGNFVTRDNATGDVDVDLAGRASMSLIAVPGVGIDNFNPAELEQLTGMCRTTIAAAGIPLAGRTLQQLFSDAFNACFFDAGIIAFLTEISDDESTGANLSANPPTLEADGHSISTITVEPLDENSMPVGPGLVVDLATNLGTITTPAIDNHDGTYTAFLTAPTTTGTASVSASNLGVTLGSTTVTLTADVTSPLAPDGSRILLTGAGASTVTLIGLPGAAEPNCTLTVENTTQSTSTDVSVTTQGGFRADVAAGAGDSLVLRCTDAAGNVSLDTPLLVGGATGLPTIGNPSAVPGGVTPSVTPLAQADLGVAVPAGFTFLRGFSLDLEGSSATSPLDVLIDSGVPLTPGRQLLLVQVIEVLEANELRVVAAADQGGGALYPLSGPSFPGVIDGGSYAYLEADTPQAFVHGTVSATLGSLGGIEGVYQTLDVSPFTDLTRADGTYLLAGPAGGNGTVGSKLYAHVAEEQTTAFLAFGGSEVTCDFDQVTRADVSFAFTSRFTGVGQTTRSLALLPSGDQLYVMLNDTGDISILDSGTLQPVSFTEDVQNITDLAFTPNGFEAFIGYFNRARDFKVSIEEPGLLISSIGFPRDVVTTPDGNLALISSSLDGSEADSLPDAVFVIDTFTNAVEGASIAVAADPGAAAISPDGSRAYTVSRTQGTVTVIDVPGRVALDTLVLGSSLADVTVSRDGSEVYVADIVSNTVLVLDAAGLEDMAGGNEVLDTIAVGAAPGSLALSPDGGTLLVAEQQGDTISRIDTVTRTVSAVWAVVDLPFDVVIHPTGTTAYVVDPLTQKGVLEIPLADADTTLPTLIDAGPRDRTVQLLQDSPIELVFDEKMDVATLSAANISVEDAGLQPIPGTLTPGEDSVSVIFTPDQGVRYELNSTVQITLETTVTDAAGNGLAAQVPVSVPTFTMQLPDLMKITMPLSTAGIEVTGEAGAVEPKSKVTITNLLTSQTFQTTALPDGSFTLGVTGLDDDGYELVTSLSGGRAKTNPVPVLPDFDIVPTDTGRISYLPGLQGTLIAVGTAGAVDIQTSDVVIRNLTSGQSFPTTSIGGDGSFSVGIFAQPGDAMDVVTTILGAIELDPLPLAVPSFNVPVIDFITPDRFVFGDPVTLSVVGTDFGAVQGNILLQVGGETRMDFILGDLAGNPTQKVIQVDLAPGANTGSIMVAVAGLTSNRVSFFAETADNTSPFAEQVIASSVVGDPLLALQASDGSFVDLGAAGSMTLRLGSTVIDGSGPDLQIFEDTADGEDCYDVQVGPASTGPFDSLGIFCGTEFVNMSGHAPIRFVRIIDANDGGNAARIDAVFAIRVQMAVSIMLVDEQGLAKALLAGPMPPSTPEMEPIYSLQVDELVTRALAVEDGNAFTLPAGKHVTLRLSSTATWAAGSELELVSQDGTCVKVLASDRATGPFVSLGESCGGNIVKVERETSVRYVRLAAPAARAVPGERAAPAKLNAFEQRNRRRASSPPAGDAPEFSGPIAAAKQERDIAELRATSVRIDRLAVPHQAGLEALAPAVDPLPGSPLAAARGITVELSPSSADTCVDEKVSLTAMVSPPPQGGGGYGGGCNDTFDWSHGGVGTIDGTGACVSSSDCEGSGCTFCALDMTGRGEVTVSVTRSGNCQSTGSAPPKSATIDVNKVDLVGHQQGKKASPGAEVSEDDEDDPEKLTSCVNGDLDEGRFEPDLKDTEIGMDDDDIVKLTLKKLESTKGMVSISVTPAADVRLFNTAGDAELADMSVDLASAMGDLAGLASGDLDLWLESKNFNADVTIKMTYTAPEGGATCSDEVHLNAKKLEIIESDEESEVDVLPLFNPNPIVTLNAIANPGTAETVNVAVSGTVKDFVAPIDEVRVNGVTAAVTQTGSGTDNMGPYEGTFNVNKMINGENAVIEAIAINSLKNLGLDRTVIAVTRNAAAAITGRTVTAENSVPQAPPNDAAFLDPFRFKIQLDQVGVMGNEVMVDVDTGEEMKMIKLTRDTGDTFKSDDLFLLPKNVVLPASAAQETKDTRIKADLGKKFKVKCQNDPKCEDVGVTTGLLILKKTDEKVTELVDSAAQDDVPAATAARAYLVRAGLPGKIGASVMCQLRGLDRLGANLTQPMPNNLFADLAPMLTLDRVSADEKEDDYNLFKADESKPVLGVRSTLPVDGSGNPMPNNNINDVYVHYDGFLQCEIAAQNLKIIEPVVGMEIVGSTMAMPTVLRAAELSPTGNPAPPILSVADGFPRPRVEITSQTDVGTAANPTRVRVQGTIHDAIADMIPGTGTNLSDVDMQLMINGHDVTGGAAGSVASITVTITHPDNNAAGSWVANFDAQVDLAMIPNMADVTHFTIFQPFGQPAGNDLKIAQEAVIVEAVNAIGNTGFDSVFVQMIESNAVPTRMPPFTTTLAANSGTHFNGGAFVGWAPPRFYVAYHNPFKTETMFNRQLRSVLPGGANFVSKNITIERDTWGNQFRYGPFLAGNVHRTTNPAPAVPDATPILPMIRYNKDAMGLVTSIDIAEKMMATAPAPSRDDQSETPALDLRITNSITGRDTFLPQGTDAAPTAVNLVVTITPARLAANRMLTLRMPMVTNFAGHTTNAPRGGGANDDYSFTAGGNNTGPTAAAGFDASGTLTQAIQVKDWGGRVLFDARITDLADDPRVFMELPLDSDGDFLPNVWERRFRTAGGTTDPNNPIRDGLEDLEDRTLGGAAVAHNEQGDGFTALEEYRGFQAMGVLARMDQIPLHFGLAYTGSAAGGNLVGGPRLKDLLVHVSTTLAISNNNAANFNLGFHRINHMDYEVDNRVGGLYTTFSGHDHRMNVHGNNDQLATSQNAAHLRDDTNLPAASQLADASTLGNAGSFFLDGIDLRLNPNGPGAGTGTWTVGTEVATGMPVTVTMNNMRRNGNTMFHEFGHKLSLFHTVETVHYMNPADPLNGMDVVGPAMAAPDGMLDGAVRIAVTQFTIEATAHMMTRAHLQGHGILGTEGVGLQIGGAAPPAVVTYTAVNAMDSFGFPQNHTWVFSGTGAIGGAATYEQNSYFPTLMDGFDYPIAMGENLQENLSGPQNSFPAPRPTHAQEVRVRTTP